MNSALRSISRHARSASRSIKPAPVAVRAFHSPFAVLGNSSSLTSPSSNVYAKEVEESSYDAFASSKTYVVCQPDPSNTFHEVPSGAYPTSAPYVSRSASSEAPERSNGTSFKSTSSNRFAHPITRTASRSL